MKEILYMGMTIIGIDNVILKRLEKHRKEGEDIDWTINRLMNKVEAIECPPDEGA
jgi:hypothetical protein